MSVAVQVHVALQLCPLELPVHREDKEYTEVIRRRGHGCVARQQWEASGRRGGTLRGIRTGLVRTCLRVGPGRAALPRPWPHE